MALQKVDRLNAVPGAPAASDETWLAEYPMLHEYLTSTSWEDSSPREVATLLIVCELGLWKGCLNDRANKRTAWFTGLSVGDLLSTIDGALVEGSAGWRANRPWTKGKGA